MVIYDTWDTTFPVHGSKHPMHVSMGHLPQVLALGGSKGMFTMLLDQILFGIMMASMVSISPLSSVQFSKYLLGLICWQIVFHGLLTDIPNL